MDVLAGLIQDGLARYRLSDTDPSEFDSMPPLDIVEEDFKTYFWTTKKGLDLQLSDDTWWPFDNDGNLPKVNF